MSPMLILTPLVMEVRIRKDGVRPLYIGVVAESLDDGS